MGKDATVNYSMYLCLVMATIRDNDSTPQTPADAQLNDVLEPAYQAEAGATQRRTLQRLKQEHGVSWGVKKLREVTTRISSAMAEERHAVQVEKLLQLLEQAWLSTGKHKPVLSVGRDGITVVLPIRKGTMDG
jgi:hypothetical protein